MDMSGNTSTLPFPNHTGISLPQVDGNMELSSVALGVVYLISSTFVLISNSIVVIVVVSSKELHVPKLWNITFMAVCDIMYGLHYLIISVPSLFKNKFAYPDVLIDPASCIMTFLFGQNVLNIVVTMVDRYICLCWPLQYPQLMTAKRFMLATGATVLINVTRLCIITLPNTTMYYNADIGICLPDYNTFLIGMASVGLPFVSVVVIVILIVKITLEIKRSGRRVNSFKFTMSVSIAASVFCFSYIPTCICIVWNVFGGLSNVSINFTKFGTVSLLSNSFWNVVIYSTGYRPFRYAFIRLMCRAYLRQKLRKEITAKFQASNSIGSRETLEDYVGKVTRLPMS